MPIDDRTTNRSYQLPHASNLLLEDVARLRTALAAIDADIYARYTKTEVNQLITDLINSAPGTLNTLQELAAALGNDPNFATTTATLLGQKANSTDVYSRTQSDARYMAKSGNKNAIINGSFSQWQEGTTFVSPANNAYLADQWQVIYDGTGATRTITREAALGQTGLPNEGGNFLRFNQSVAGFSATFNILQQPIESATTFAGGKEIGRAHV